AITPSGVQIVPSPTATSTGPTTPGRTWPAHRTVVPAAPAARTTHRSRGEVRFAMTTRVRYEPKARWRAHLRIVGVHAIITRCSATDRRAVPPSVAAASAPSAPQPPPRTPRSHDHPAG